MRHLYIHGLTLKRKVLLEDGQGGTTEKWGAIKTFRGRIRPASASEKMAADQERAYITHVIYCDPDVGVKRGDRIQYGDLVIDVTAIREPSYAGHHLEVEGVAIQYG